MTFRTDRRTLLIVRRVQVGSAGFLLAFLAFVAAGCFGGGGTKAGGESVNRITLAMETPDAPDADAEFFIQEVKRRTGGRIRIVEAANEYSSGDPDNELRLVRALRSGKVKIAYVTSRAWERDGVLSFRALQAPFLITSYELLRRVATGPVGQEMLSSLERVGLVGLGLVPSELRRPLGRRELVSASDFRGARIRVVTSPTSVLAFRALGAVPVTNLTSDQVGPALLKGRLDGVESSTHSISGYTYAAPYLPSNLALFPKTQTIVIGRETFDRLSPNNQLALREAAAATVAHADPAGGERDEIRALCNEGLHLVRATSAGLASLRHATARVYVELEREPQTKREIVGIEHLKQEVSASPDLLPACPRGKGLPGSAKNPLKPAKSRFPEGTFETMITRQDLIRAGLNQFPNYPATQTMIVKDGTWRAFLTPRRPEQPDAGGRVIVRGDQVTFVVEYPPEGKGTRDVLKWSYFQNRLTFQVVDVPDAGARLGYTAHPYRKVIN
jgi:TRAP-type C4-dicarboxylate transport system substrate-binding protein